MPMAKTRKYPLPVPGSYPDAEESHRETDFHRELPHTTGLSSGSRTPRNRRNNHGRPHNLQSQSDCLLDISWPEYHMLIILRCGFRSNPPLSAAFLQQAPARPLPGSVATSQFFPRVPRMHGTPAGSLHVLRSPSSSVYCSLLQSPAIVLPLPEAYMQIPGGVYILPADWLGRNLPAGSCGSLNCCIPDSPEFPDPSRLLALPPLPGNPPGLPLP